MSSDAFVVQTGVTCGIGNSAMQCSAAFRASLSGYEVSSVQGRNQEGLRLSLVPEPELEPLVTGLEHESLTCRERRLLRLGGQALRPMANLSGPLFLALPQPAPGARQLRDDFVSLLNTQAQAQFDARASKVFRLGRAGGFFALQAALAALCAGASRVLVGGIDTCLDPRLLASLEAEGRLLTSEVRDGFTPGEAAAFLCLSRARATPQDTILRAVGTAEDPGHRYSQEPALGVGLSAALDAMQWRSRGLPSVRTCFSGLNGENFGAKAWGVAHMRHHALFAPDLAFEHTADVHGDVGAATATLLLALADETLRNDQRPAPALVWAASDHAPCGAAYLTTPDGAIAR